MIYSVWKWGHYDYYRADDGVGMGDRVQARLKFPSDNQGRPLEAVLPVVPQSAIKIGVGDKAKGRVAVLPNESVYANSVGMGGWVQENPWVSLGLTLGGFYIFYKLLVGAAKRV
jgi:hypothetical protein